MKKEIKEFFQEDDYIPERFAMWNAIILGSELVIFGSKKAWVKLACAMLGAFGAFRMNGDMANFMRAMLDKR